jgi:hypothetical protein
MVVLQDTKNGKASSMADLQAQLDALKAENAKLKEARLKSLSFKVSEKGALSVYVWVASQSHFTVDNGKG